MNFEWVELSRIAIMGIGTFALGAFIKPLFLAFRDYCVWRLMGCYLDKSDFHKRANQYAGNLAKHNKMAEKKLHSIESEDGVKCYLGDEEISQERFNLTLEEIDRTKDHILRLRRRLHMERGAIGSALKHYNQEGSNPATCRVPCD